MGLAKIPSPLNVPELRLQSGDFVTYESGAYSETEAGVGAKAGATVSVMEYGDSILHKTVLTLAATPITVTDEAGVGQYGGVKIYDFPEGLILSLGAVIDASVTLGVTGTITDTWEGDVGLGTTVINDSTGSVAGHDEILETTAVAAATGKVAAIDAVTLADTLVESGAVWLNGTATAKDLYLNLDVDDSGTHTTGTGTITGTVTITWINLGDK